MNTCDYYKRKQPGVINCPNCDHWLGAKCAIEDKVLRNDKTAIVHEPTYYGGTGRVSRVLR